MECIGTLATSTNTLDGSAQNQLRDQHDLTKQCLKIDIGDRDTLCASEERSYIYIES